MTNKETIYRQDVLDLAKKGVLISNGNYESVCKAINELPSVNPQPCEDAISREHTLAEFKRWHFDDKTVIRCAELVLKYEPPVTPQPKTGHWIPVSERLPEESLNSVIGWDAYRERCVFVQYIDGYFQITGSAESFDIVAWMPLPEPYEPQERSDKA